MQLAGLAATGFQSKLLEHPIEPGLMRGRHRQEFHADPCRSAPTDGGFFNGNGCGFTWNVQQYGHLHPCKGADDAVHTTTLCGEIADGAGMVKMFAMHQRALQGDRKSRMFSRDHNRVRGGYYAKACSKRERNCRSLTRPALHLPMPRLYTIPTPLPSPLKVAGNSTRNRGWWR